VVALVAAGLGLDEHQIRNRSAGNGSPYLADLYTVPANVYGGPAPGPLWTALRAAGRIVGGVGGSTVDAAEATTDTGLHP
jgi:hypothetical protein